MELELLLLLTEFVLLELLALLAALLPELVALLEELVLLVLSMNIHPLCAVSMANGNVVYANPM